MTDTQYEIICDLRGELARLERRVRELESALELANFALGNATKPETNPPCDHKNKRYVCSTPEGLGTVTIDWCPDCGGLKRTMINWNCTDYPWELPKAHRALT
jgi:hypothetical protein